MRWVLGIVGILVALVLIVVVVGMLLPKSHVASASATYSAPPDSIWATLTDVRAFPTWRRDLKRVELLPDENGQLGWRETGSNGVIPFRVVESVRSQRLVTRIADPKLPFGGTWTYVLTPAGTGTSLTITENGEIYNPIFRFVSRFVLGYTATMTGMLRAIGAKHGETVTPTPAAVQ
jgi:uncharacterized protein YndB with AHSA1/START domain